MLFFAALAFGDLFAVDAHIDRCLDADANLRAIDCHHGDFDIFTDSQRFPGPASEYEHRTHLDTGKNVCLWAIVLNRCRTAPTFGAARAVKANAR
jgi:hypothetical protein